MTVIGNQVGLTLDRIVLATDFSPASEKAAGYAQGLAKRFSSSLSLATVVDLSVAGRSEAAAAGLRIDEIQRYGAQNRERLLTTMLSAGVRASAHTMDSHDPAASLANMAKELRADLIVTGMAARTEFSKSSQSSCGEGIIRHAECRVLTVGPKAKPAPNGALSFHTVVFASDFSPQMKIQAAVALSFAQDSIAQVYFCHVLEPQGKDISDTLEKGKKSEAALEKLMPQSTFDRCSPGCVVEPGTAASHILELASRVNADLIVLGAEHSASWCTHMMGGTVEQVLMNAECPVMTVAATKRETVPTRYALRHRSSNGAGNGEHATVEHQPEPAALR